MSVSLSDVDLTQPEAIADPYPIYRRLLAELPVHRSDSLGGWVLARYDDVQAALRDARLTADRFSPIYRQLPPDAQAFLQPIAELTSRWTLFFDPPVHTRMRALTSEAFSARNVARMRPLISNIVSELLRDLAQSTRFDLVSSFAGVVPTMVISEVVGIPAEDRVTVQQWATPILHFFSVAAPPPEVAVAGRQAVIDMSQYLRDVVAERRKKPVEDLISTLVSTEVDGHRLSTDDIVADCLMLFNAGHETMRSLLAIGTQLLLSHPTELQRLLKNPGLLPAAIEEMLRYESPVQRTSRMVREECVYGGHQLRPGEIVWVLLGAASRDPAHFSRPDEFDISRHPNRHIAFASGPHFCEGAPLARLEGEIAFTALLDWLPRMRLLNARPDWYLSVSATRSLRTLPVEICATGS